MQNTRTFVAIAAFFLFSFTFIAGHSTAHARDPKGLVGVGVDAGFGILAGPDWLESTGDSLFVPGAHLRYHVTSNWAVQGAFRYLKHMDSGQRGYVGEAAVQYWLSPDATVTPVFGFGLGFTRVTNAIYVTNDKSFINLSVSPSIGVEGWVCDSMTLGALVRYHGVLANSPVDNELHSIEPTLTATWYLGGAKRVAATNLTTAPRTVSVKDTDGDSVADNDDKCPSTPAGSEVNSFGCPRDEKASFKLNVNFDTGSARIKATSQREIADLAAFLGRHEHIKAVLEGHTDSTGNSENNKKLSQDRAQALVDRLINTHGISADRLKAVGYGSEQPLSDNNTAAGRLLNRRVVVTVQE